jgi:predicted MarR family transcription regulator
MFHGSTVTRRDGFIHLSTCAQVVETAAKHFAGIRDLLLVDVIAAAIGRNGNLRAAARCSRTFTAISISPRSFESSRRRSAPMAATAFRHSKGGH